MWCSREAGAHNQEDNVSENAITHPRRSRHSVIAGVISLIVALLIFLLAYEAAGEVSTFVLTSQRAGVNIPAPDLVLSASTTIAIIGAMVAAGAVWELVRGFKHPNRLIIAAAVLGILAFLVWATQGKSLNLTGMLVSSVVRATPIALAALSGIYSERSGVVNIGIEGMMLMGAFFSVVFASITGNMLIGVIGGILAGVVLGLLHGVLSIRYMVNQIISGTGIIILSLGLTSYLQRAILNVYPNLNSPGPSIASTAIPVLWRIPVIGPVFFNQSPLIYLLIVLLVVTQIILYYTVWGLRMRSVGEHPRAADTLGINVYRIRYISVMISGAIAGLAGAYMSIGAAGRFNEGMTAGKGFLGLAAMIFGNWNPGGAFLGSLIFGFFVSLAGEASILQVGIPVDLWGWPHIATMVVRVGFTGAYASRDGTPYQKQ
jgi:simple sugar transport system permease protein